MGDGSGDIAAEPPMKKPKKSRNRHACKKNGKRAVYMFDVVGGNGLPPVRLLVANPRFTPGTFSDISGNFVLLFVHDHDKDDALALRIVAIHKCWQPHSVREGQISLSDWLLRALAYCDATASRW